MPCSQPKAALEIFRRVLELLGIYLVDRDSRVSSNHFSSGIANTTDTKQFASNNCVDSLRNFKFHHDGGDNWDVLNRVTVVRNVKQYRKLAPRRLDKTEKRFPSIYIYESRVALVPFLMYLERSTQWPGKAPYKKGLISLKWGWWLFSMWYIFSNSQGFWKSAPIPLC